MANKPMRKLVITRFIKTNNGAIHLAARVSPTQMQGNKDLEVQYINESINKQNKMEITTPNYKLMINEEAGGTEPKKTLKKTRDNIGPYYFTIIDVSGKSITISTVDDSFKAVSRSQIIHIDITRKIKEAQLIGDSVSCSSYYS
jgi:hypothetical protein